MKVKILTFGEKMPSWVNQAVEEYQKRLPLKFFSIDWCALPIAHRHKNFDLQKTLIEEAACVFKIIKPTDYLVIFDVGAKTMTTELFAQNLADWQQNSHKVVMLIGGPDGFDESIRKRANMRISLSPMTFAHPLVRVILTEQIYRAWTILQNHPYHK